MSDQEARSAAQDRLRRYEQPAPEELDREERDTSDQRHGTSAAIVARCATCNMSLCPDDTDCGTTGCTAERDIARADDWKRRALAAEERVRRLEAIVYPPAFREAEALHDA